MTDINAVELILEEFDKNFAGNYGTGFPVMQDRIRNFLFERLSAFEAEIRALAYHSPCAGCPEGHSSFWKTIVESDEWKAWEKVANEQGFDTDESRECGWFSSKHFQAFLEFTITNKQTK